MLLTLIDLVVGTSEVVSHDGPVNAGSVDPVMAQTVELEALDGTPGSSTFGHCLEQRLLPLGLVVGLVSVPQDDVPSLAVVDQIKLVITTTVLQTLLPAAAR